MQRLAQEYKLLKGQKEKDVDSVIVSIIIQKEKGQHRVCSFYYLSGSQAGNDPVELYSYRKPRFSITIHYV